jgi:GTPase SAR1 family protein
MSVDNQSSSNALPLRDGAFEIRRQCPQFRILVIGKANAGKTTILRKVCNAKPDAKPIVYDAGGRKIIVNDAEREKPIVNDAEGKKVKRDLANVCHANLRVSGTN